MGREGGAHGLLQSTPTRGNSVVSALCDLLPPLMEDSNVLMKDHKAFLVATEVSFTRMKREYWYLQENLNKFRNNLIKQKILI